MSADRWADRPCWARAAVLAATRERDPFIEAMRDRLNKPALWFWAERKYTESASVNKDDRYRRV